MMVSIDDNVPVAMLLRALTHEGFELVGTPQGLVLRLSTRYSKDGECCGGFVPEFLRYLPDALSICPTV